MWWSDKRTSSNMHVTAWTPFPPPTITTSHPNIQCSQSEHHGTLIYSYFLRESNDSLCESNHSTHEIYTPHQLNLANVQTTSFHRKKERSKKKYKKRRKQMTHPDPLPPTMAIFFPAGTQNVIPCRIFCPGTYSKYTSSKVMVDVGGSTCSTGAPTSLWHHRHKLNLCDDTCVKAISIQRHDPEHTQAEFMWWHMC